MSVDKKTEEKAEADLAPFVRGEATPVRYVKTDRSVIVAGRHYTIFYTKLADAETAGDRALIVQKMVLTARGLEMWTKPPVVAGPILRFGIPHAQIDFWRPEDA